MCVFLEQLYYWRFCDVHDVLCNLYMKRISLLYNEYANAYMYTLYAFYIVLNVVQYTLWKYKFNVN